MKKRKTACYYFEGQGEISPVTTISGRNFEPAAVLFEAWSQLPRHKPGAASARFCAHLAEISDCQLAMINNVVFLDPIPSFQEWAKTRKAHVFITDVDSGEVTHILPTGELDVFRRDPEALWVPL